MNMLRRYRQQNLWMWSLPLQTLHTLNRSLYFFYKPRLKRVFKELKLEFSFSVERFYMKWVLKLQPLRRMYWIPSVSQSKPISGTVTSASCCPSLLLMVLFTLSPTSLLSPGSHQGFHQLHATGSPVTLAMSAGPSEGPSILYSTQKEGTPLESFYVDPAVPTAFICSYQKPWLWYLCTLGPKNSFKSPQPWQPLPGRALQCCNHPCCSLTPVTQDKVTAVVLPFPSSTAWWSWGKEKTTC